MGIGTLQRFGTGLAALALGLCACSGPSGRGEGEIESVRLGAQASDLRASTWVKLWSDLPKDRGGAHFQACQDQRFRFTLAFRNMGDAIWRDVHGRGDEPGTDVFLETANGKNDKLAGKKRFSLRWNANDYVRGDRKAKECTTKPGCRRTRAIHDGVPARAPAAVGIYKSRWRLRDYSKAWDEPKGFGPIVEFRVRVVDCPELNECACKVECSDASKTVLWMVGGSEPACESAAALHCLPYEVVTQQFLPCPEPPDGGAGGSGGAIPAGGASGVNAEEPPDGPGYWITEPGSGGGGTSGWGGSSGSAGSSWWGGEEDPGIGTTPDDPDYEPDGFDGVAEDVQSSVVREEDGCSFATSQSRSAAWVLGASALLGALARRRGQKRS